MIVVGSVLLAAVLLFAVPAVRLELRKSFTRMPQPTVAMYFTDSPSVEGTVLKIPITVQGVDTGKDVYGVRVWTVDAAGAVDGGTTAKIRWDGHTTATIVTLPVKPDAAVVWVSLDGTKEALHYKIATS